MPLQSATKMNFAGQNIGKDQLVSSQQRKHGYGVIIWPSETKKWQINMLNSTYLVRELFNKEERLQATVGHPA